MNKILENDFKEIAGSMDFGFLNKTNILITGSGGMIGGYLLSFLSYLNETKFDKSIEIVAIDRFLPNVHHRSIGHLVSKTYIDFRQSDLSHEFNLDHSEDFDYIIHAASNASPKSYLADPIGTMNTNVKTTQFFLEFARDSERLKKMLYVSSGEIYGSPSDENVPTPESYLGLTDHLNERSCYVESKRYAETLCRNYFTFYGVPVTFVRPVHIYGPGFSPQDGRVWADFIGKAARGEDIVILSDGQSRRGFCYLSDAIIQFLTVLKHGVAGEPYNIGNDRHISIKELAETVNEAVVGKIRIEIKNDVPEHLKNSPRISCASIEKVNDLAESNGIILRTVHPDEGIRRCLEWSKTTEEGKKHA